MDPDSRRSIQKVGLVLIALGLLQALVISTFSRDPAILSFGFGPAFIGLFMFVTSFFELKQAKNPIPMWRKVAFFILSIALWLPGLFFGYHFPAYILVAYFAVGALLYWPVKRRPDTGNQEPFASGGAASS